MFGREGRRLNEGYVGKDWGEGGGRMKGNVSRWGDKIYVYLICF